MGNNPCLASAAERSGVAGGGNPPAKSRRDRSSPSRGSKRQDNTGVQTTTERTNTLLQAVVETLTLPSLHSGARDNPEEAMQKRQEFKHRINQVLSGKYLT